MPKLNSNYDAHRVLYVTHELQHSNGLFYVAFEGIHYIQRTDWKNKRMESQVQINQSDCSQKFQLFSNNEYKKIEREAAIHIPYDIYNNYLSLIQKLPNITNKEFQLCRCQ